MACLLLGSVANSYAVDYYFDSVSGNDNNSGRAQSAPWKSLIKYYNSVTAINAGDTFNFKRGSTFYLPFRMTGARGTTARKIYVRSYGTTGEKPIINAAGYINGIDLVNCSYVTVQGLEIKSEFGTNREDNANLSRAGIRVRGERDVADNIVLYGLNIRAIYPTEGTANDESGNHGQKHYDGNGIFMETYGTDGRVRNVSVQQCVIEDIASAGIKLVKNAGYGTPPSRTFSGIEISNNTIQNVGNSCILPFATENLSVTNNSLQHSGAVNRDQQFGRGSCMWVYNCKNVLVSNNWFAHARGIGDSYGCHIDDRNDHVIIQRNFSWDNAGGFIEILGESTHSCYRYNVSYNDGWRIRGSTNPQGIRNLQDGFAIIITSLHSDRPAPAFSYIYNNTVVSDHKANFYIDPRSTAVGIENNIFALYKGGNLPFKPINALTGNHVRRNAYISSALALPAGLGVTDATPFYGPLVFGNLTPSQPWPWQFLPNNRTQISNTGVKIGPLPNDTKGLGFTLPDGQAFGYGIVYDILEQQVNNNVPDLGAIHLN